VAWTTLPTYSDGNVLTAAQLNAIAANINESAPAKATATGRLIVTTAANAIAERVPTVARITGGAQTTTSTTLTDLTTTGPQIATLATGTSAIFTVSAFCFNTSAGQGCYVGCAVSGASTIAGDLFRSLRIMSGAASENSKQSYIGAFGNGGGTNLTAGNNTFTAKYASTSGAATATFDERELMVLPL
jgi:hypothetical protein